jgi:hypothetical protein
VNELRRALLDEGDAPAELSPELRFLAARQAALGAVLVNHAEIYRQLLISIEAEGQTSQTEAIALDAAGTLGLLLQSLRSREEQLVALRLAPQTEAPPLVAIDQLMFSFVVLSAPADADERMLCLTAGELDELLATASVQKWLMTLGIAPAAQS